MTFLNETISKLSCIYYKNLFEEKMFRTNSLQLSDVNQIGGIITKTLQCAKGESRVILMGDNHV